METNGPSGFLNMTPRELAEAARAGLDRLDRASLDLAKQGWALPMSLTPAETYGILSAGLPDAVDDAFVGLYEADEGRHFERLTETLLNRDVLVQWRHLLEQTVSAYKRRDFAITIPSLLIVCEGVLMVGKGNRTDLKSVVRQRAEAAQCQSPGFIATILWCSVHRFIDELFAKSDFSGLPPARLNRHWILHGRDSPRWNQADSLRLFLAADTISALSDDRA